MVALKPTYRIFLNFATNCILSCLSTSDNIKNWIFDLYAPKAEIKGVFFAGNTVAMATYCVTKKFTNGWAVFFTMIVAATDKEWL